MAAKKAKTQQTPSRMANPAPTAVPLPAGKRRLFRWIAMVLPLGLLVFAELALRFADWGYPTHYFSRTETGSSPVFGSNPKFGWSFFPQRLARAPEPLRLTLAKPPGTCRIIVFGESAALGDPEPAYGFSRILAELLEARCPGTKFEVVNVGMTAISSHVITRIAEDCVPFQADIWIVYMGNNEVVGPFGAGSVFGLKSPPLWLVRASLAAKRTRLGQALDTLWQRASPHRADTREWEGMRMMLQEQMRAQDPKLRPVYDHFQSNLETILALAGRAGAKSIVCSVSSNLKDCPPFASLHRPDLSGERLNEWPRLYTAGKELESRQEYAPALGQYRLAAALDDSFAELSFRIARCELALGESAPAFQDYVRARDQDVLRFRTDSRLNDIIRSVCAAHAASNIHFFDAEAAVTHASKPGLPGADYFWDHVHFNFAGNYLLARGLAGEVLALLPEPTRQAALKTPFLSETECAERLALTDWDRRAVLDQMCRRIQEPPFTDQLDHPRRLAQWSAMLAEMDRKQDPEALARAIQTYRNALDRRPGDWILHDRLAFLLETRGDVLGAQQHWLKVVELVPGHPEACFKLADIRFRESEFAEAESYYRQVLESRPGSLEVMNGLGLLRLSQNKPEEAVRMFRQALQIEPRFAQAHVNWGLVLSRSGNPAEAETHYREALRSDSECTAAHINLGNLLVAQQKHAEACDHYRKAIEIRPAQATVHLGLANSLDALGRGPEALAEYQRAVRLNPALFEAQFNLGVALAKQGDLKAAIPCFQESVRLNPGDSQARLSLGVALVRQNRRAEATIQFQEVLRLDPSNATAPQYLQGAPAGKPARP